MEMCDGSQNYARAVAAPEFSMGQTVRHDSDWFYEPKELTMKKLTILLLLGGFTLGLAGCNTMEGLGEDIESGGEELEEEANEAQH